MRDNQQSLHLGWNSGTATAPLHDEPQVANESTLPVDRNAATKPLPARATATRSITEPDEDATTGDPLPFLPVTLQRDGVTLSVFTTLTTLGTPRDAGLQEMRIECFYPADEASRRALERITL